MKQTALLAGAALVLTSAAIAAPGKDKKPAPATPEKVHCAVMKDREVNVKDATAHHMYADYKGNRYFFCCGGCPGQFKADPAKFAKNDHIPTPKTGKAKS